MSENSKIIISNRGKVTGSMRARAWIGGLIAIVIGICCLIYCPDLDGYYYGSEKYMPYIILAGGIFALTLGIGSIMWDIMYQKSFLEFRADGVYGAAFTMNGINRITPPRQFELSYSDIQRLDSEKGFILVVTSSETYRCRGKGMEDDFRKAFKNMAQK